MSTYTVTTNFANKDSLPSGSSDKIIKGSEFTAEFNNISTAINGNVTDISDNTTAIATLNTALDGKLSTGGGTVDGNLTVTGALTLGDSLEVLDFVSSKVILTDGNGTDERQGGQIWAAGNNLKSYAYNWNNILGTYTAGTHLWYSGHPDDSPAASMYLSNNTLTVNAVEVEELHLSGTQVTATATEINYLDGVTSNIQTQIDNAGNSPWNIGSDFISMYTGGTFGGIYIFDRDALSSGSAHYIEIDHDASLNNSYYNRFSYQGVTAGSITRSGTTGVAYNTSSDYRLKENVVSLDSAIDRVKALSPCRFNFIGEQRTVDGFLAHEAQAVVPESVVGNKDAVDSEGNPVYQGIDQSKLVPLLTAALQEAIARIEVLEGGL